MSIVENRLLQALTEIKVTALKMKFAKIHLMHAPDKEVVRLIEEAENCLVAAASHINDSAMMAKQP